MLNIAVIDAQGGGLGKIIVERLKIKYNKRIVITALGTNVVATTAMKKAGAVQYATGENAICFNSERADVIIGGIGIITANGMLGEITGDMAKAVSSSKAVKILIPFEKCNIKIPGTEQYQLNDLINLALEKIDELFENIETN